MSDKRYTVERKFYTTSELCEILGVCRHTLKDLVRSGKMPKPIKGLTKESRYLVSEVQQHFDFILEFNGKEKGLI